MTTELKIAAKCREIIADPGKNIGGVYELLQLCRNVSTGESLRGTIYLSVMKVFLNIVPLYRVRTLKEAVKHKNDTLHVRECDKEVLRGYNAYIKMVVEDRSRESYIAACEVLRSLDHFNCIDKIISKLLLGTTEKRGISTLCCSAIKEKIMENRLGETVHLILNLMLDYNYSAAILEYLLEIPSLDLYLRSDLEKQEERHSENARVSGRERDSIFRRKAIHDKKVRKEDKMRRMEEIVARFEEREEVTRDEFANHKKVADALQRLYFTILKEKDSRRYKFTFMGISKYRKAVRPAFLEGLYILLNDAIEDASCDAKIQGILAVLKIYGGAGYDFKRLVDALYAALHPLNFEVLDLDGAAQAARLLFVRTRQPKARAYALISRLIHCACVRPLPMFCSLIAELASSYDVEFGDCEDIRHAEYNHDVRDIDLVPVTAFYEYYLYRRLL
jgi:nucleolar complex protein 3